MDSVSVIVKTQENKTVVIAGDLFEKEEDLRDSSIWVDAGSEDKKQQEIQRLRILELAEFIVPGHGPMFKVTTDAKETYEKLIEGLPVIKKS